MGIEETGLFFYYDIMIYNILQFTLKSSEVSLMKKFDDKNTEELTVDNFKYSKENEELVKNSFWTKMKKSAGKIPFTKDAIAMYYCAVDAKTPLWAKGIAFGALAYFVSPIDAIPDVIIGLGFTDDAALIAAGIRAISGQVTDEHRNKSEAFFNGEK
jgi:uncharacterized membrane protein YkvA (DUF1232 family)